MQGDLRTIFDVKDHAGLSPQAEVRLLFAREPCIGLRHQCRKEEEEVERHVHGEEIAGLVWNFFKIFLVWVN